jgi:hypothetical protein
MLLPTKSRTQTQDGEVVEILLVVTFLLSKAPEGAFAMIYRPAIGVGGGLPLHVTCRSYSSIGSSQLFLLEILPLLSVVMKMVIYLFI